MKIKKYNNFILEKSGDNIVSRLSRLNIKEINHILNNLITADSHERPNIISSLIEELESRKIDISDIKDDLLKLCD